MFAQSEQAPPQCVCCSRARTIVLQESPPRWCCVACAYSWPVQLDAEFLRRHHQQQRAQVHRIETESQLRQQLADEWRQRDEIERARREQEETARRQAVQESVQQQVAMAEQLHREAVWEARQRAAALEAIRARAGRLRARQRERAAARAARKERARVWRAQQRIHAVAQVLGQAVVALTDEMMQGRTHKASNTYTVNFRETYVDDAYYFDAIRLYTWREEGVEPCRA